MSMSPTEDTGASERYNVEVEALQQWFQEKLSTLPPIEITQADYRNGTDSLHGDYAKIVEKAFATWLQDRNYELSYSQMCIAFFNAAITSMKLTIKE